MEKQNIEDHRIKQAVILAGGRGTRLKPFTDTMPKAMYPFENIPFLGYLLAQVRSYGIEEVLILLGYLPEKITGYVKDGSHFGLQVRYDVTPVEYETGARLVHAESKLKEDFLLLYCDNYCPVDMKRAVDSYFASDALAQVTAYANRDGYTRNNLAVDENHKVTCYDKTRKAPGLSMVDIGYALVNKSVIRQLYKADKTNVNFEEAVYGPLTKEGRLYAFKTEHRYYSVGSWEKIGLTETFFQPKKAVFLDRDGTLNEKAEKAQYIRTPDQFVWLPGARRAVKLLKENGYLVILVTNQPGIARGMVTTEQVDQIHQKLQADLKSCDCQIDAIYMCPHGWDEGCFCRKPEPGLLFQAQRDFSLNLRETVLMGDDDRDLMAGQAAGCQRTVKISGSYPLYRAVEDLLQAEHKAAASQLARVGSGGSVAARIDEEEEWEDRRGEIWE